MKIGYHFASDPFHYYLSEKSRPSEDHLGEILKKFTAAGCRDVIFYYSSRPVRSARQGEHMASYILEKLKRGDVVVVDSCFFDLGFKQSYFSRFARKLREKGVHLMSLNGSVNTKTKGGDEYLESLCQYLEQKTELNRKVTREGVAKAIRHGRKPGRRRALANDRLPEAFALLKKEKISVAQVAKSFNISSRTLYRYIKQHGLT